MLKSMLKTLKSQKSQKSSSTPHQIASLNQNKQQNQQVQQYKISNQIIEKCELISQISQKIQKIRYFLLPNLPSLYNKVLGCPISTFHYLPHGQRKVKQIDLKSYPFPQYLQFMKPLLEKQLPDYNHILINHYEPGIGIMPHSDGPAYKSKVIVLSLNSFCMINFQQSCNSSDEKAVYPWRILLEPNSIHIFEQQAYSSYLHGISNYQIDSILLKYDPQLKKCESNVNNYQLLACRQQIEQQIAQMEHNQYSETIVGDIRIIKLEQNPQYTHKAQITRRQRISITIRHNLDSK